MLKRSKTYPPHGLSLVLRGTSRTEDSDSLPYFDNGLFRTSSERVLQQDRKEKNEREFLDVLGAADVHLDARGMKMAFLMAVFGTVERMKVAFKHGAGTRIDSYDWEGAGFTADEISRIKEYLLRGRVSNKGEYYRDSVCHLI